jgi:hypothetical protein
MSQISQTTVVPNSGTQPQPQQRPKLKDLLDPQNPKHAAFLKKDEKELAKFDKLFEKMAKAQAEGKDFKPSIKEIKLLKELEQLDLKPKAPAGQSQGAPTHPTTQPTAATTPKPSSL